ncbi:hypothetical protein [Pseudomonas sp. PLMAX]|uniref:hypothetical protein n=1 Tax=Pseudomonas sp. PLMAX TaxID=2201998 RepID=UPI0038BD029D
MSNQSPATALAALKMATLAIEEVISCGGLPAGDEEADIGGEAQVESVLALAKQYAGKRVSEEALVAAIDAMSPLFPALAVSWK